MLVLGNDYHNNIVFKFDFIDAYGVCKIALFGFGQVNTFAPPPHSIENRNDATFID